MKEASFPKTAKTIGGIAYRSLLEELYTSPKPGLVDLCSNGAHTDMDVSTFEISAAVLRPYYIRMASMGLSDEGTEQELFVRIRRLGRCAERDMFQATGGVNTHKGLIFTLGIYCAAAGRCIKNENLQDESLRMIQKKMTYRSMCAELAQIPRKKARTKGEDNLLKYGLSGIRGTVKNACPEVWEMALPSMRKELMQGISFQKVKLQTLMRLMQVMEDSNIVGRHNPDMLTFVRKRAGDFLDDGGVYVPDYLEKLYQMDQLFIRHHVSPGGSADMLALTIFLHLLLDA